MNPSFASAEFSMNVTLSDTRERHLTARARRNRLAPVHTQIATTLFGLVALAIPATAAEWSDTPSFARSVEQAASRSNDFFATRPDVPVPRDAGGGYTHETHKQNAIAIFEAGRLYRWTGQAVFAERARDLLLTYADLYPTLGEHPQKKEQSPGRLFWQSLNEAVWLVYAIQGYEPIAAALDDTAREKIERGLFDPLVDFLSVQSPQTFDRIHNHGTWAVAATGMTGYVLGDDTLVQRALLGLQLDGSAGFLRQLDELFSPDGYYNEGPYYQRYALMPFVLFARAIDIHDPDRRIFEHRDGVLVKAIRTTVQLSYAGLFFPLNDAIKDKGLDTVEVDYALPIAYAVTRDPSFLSLIAPDHPLVLTDDALTYARARAGDTATAFRFASMQLRDGANGDRGRLTILRGGTDDSPRAIVFKATSHGMGHGHFDRLNWLYYDDAEEVVTDYGAARFLNIVQKNGGHYLPENVSWARQTVAHNTLVAGERSQFDANVRSAEAAITRDHYFSASGPLKIVSAVEPSAYPGVTFRRTMLALDAGPGGRPVLFDVLGARSETPQRFDLPMYYRGHVVETDDDVYRPDALEPMGRANGYQHLHDLGHYHVAANARDAMTWLGKRHFYSLSTVSSIDATVHHTRVGATDPDFSLRPEPGILRRFKNTKDLLTVGVLVTHGEYNGAREYTRDSRNPVSALEHRHHNGRDLITALFTDGSMLQVALSYDASPDSEHRMPGPNGRPITWRGFAALVSQDNAP